MSRRGKVTKSEIVLLGLTALFLCALAVLSAQDRAGRTPAPHVETEVQVPPEEIAPDFPPVDLNTAGWRSWIRCPASGRRWPGGSSPSGRPTAPLPAWSSSWR